MVGMGATLRSAKEMMRISRDDPPLSALWQWVSGINGPAHCSTKNHHHRDDASMMDEAPQLKELRIGLG